MKTKIFVNQLGYGTMLPKTAAIIGNSSAFSVVRDGGGVVFNGVAGSPRHDDSSDDEVRTADFSALKRAGRYRIYSGGRASAVFTVSDDVFSPLRLSLLKALYYSRCGEALDPGYIGEYSHPACHGQAILPDGKKISRDLTGGWHTSGGYGRFTTPACAATATLLYAYNMFPDIFTEVTLPGGSLPDVLTECRRTIDWLLRMQDNDGGVHHKLASARHPIFTMPQEDKSEVILFPVSHSATANACAVFALASRIFEPHDHRFASSLTSAAIRGFEWLSSHTEFSPFKNPDGVNTLSYTDNDFRDDYLWTLCELYSLTGDSELHERITELAPSVDTTRFAAGDVGGFAGLSYLFGGRETRTPTGDAMKTAFIYEADYISTMSDKSGYGVAKRLGSFLSGGNLEVLTNTLRLAAADRIYRDDSHIRAAVEQLNYILGKNPLGMSFITGFGECSVKSPHHRPSMADGIDAPFAGLIVGGPDMLRSDECMRWLIPQNTPPAKCYVDSEYAFSANEPSITYTATAVFAAGYLESLCRDKG